MADQQITDPMLHGITAAQRLMRALALFDVKLPSVRGGFPVMDQGYVELGGCSAEEAEKFAAVLEKLHQGR